MAENMIFTSIDKQILESYEVSLAGLSHYLGSGYEIVLHSLENLDHSVVAIFNGERTGRRIGAPVTDLALQMLSRIKQEGMQDFITYTNRNRAGEPLRSTTILIRGENERVIGLLCINFYLNTPLYTIMQDIGVADEMHNAAPIETFSDEVNDLVGTMINEARANVAANLSISPSNRNKEIVFQLYERGVFNLKNAVVEVAQQLNISRNTVYMHIRNIEKTK